jgi:hypothetical protein
MRPQKRNPFGLPSTLRRSKAGAVGDCARRSRSPSSISPLPAPPTPTLSSRQALEGFAWTTEFQEIAEAQALLAG